MRIVAARAAKSITKPVSGNAARDIAIATLWDIKQWRISILVQRCQEVLFLDYDSPHLLICAVLNE